MWRLVFESAVTSVRFLLFFGRRREEEVKEEEEEDEEETPEQQQKRSSSSETKNIHLLKSPLEKLLQTHPEIFSFHISPHLDKNISNFAACSRECFEASIKAKSRLPTLPEEISNIRTVQMCKLALDRGLDVNNRQNIHALIRGSGANSHKKKSKRNDCDYSSSRSRETDREREDFETRPRVRSKRGV